jgi:glycosyltransferase involved in cell wall biosynthesis
MTDSPDKSFPKAAPSFINNTLSGMRKHPSIVNARFLLKDACENPFPMNLVSLTYTKKPQFNRPEDWFYRIRPYLGVLEQLGRYFTVYSIDRIQFGGDVFLRGVHHHFPEAAGGRLRVALRLNRLTHHFKPDVVLVQGMNFPLQVLLLKLRLGRRVKIIVQNHAEKPGGGLRGWLQWLSDPFISAYLFTALEMGNEWISRGIIRRAGKVREIMEASSVFSVKDRERAMEQTGVQGSPAFYKDPLTVIQAFLRFAQIRPAARLYMIFQSRELLPAIEELLSGDAGAGKCVYLLGEKPHDEMEAYYNAADYVISASHYEGSGFAVCEAMSCGVIPILTDILSFRRMTDNGSCGILYRPGDVESLFLAINRITACDKDIERAKVLRRFREALSFEVIAAGIHQVVLSL